MQNCVIEKVKRPLRINGNLILRITGQTVLKTMFSGCIDDIIRPDNPICVIDAFIDGTDIAELGFIRSFPEGTGRPGYDSRDILKLYI